MSLKKFFSTLIILSIITVIVSANFAFGFEQKVNPRVYMQNGQKTFTTNEKIKVEYRDLRSINTYTVLQGVGNNVSRSKTNWHKWNNGVYDFSKHKLGNYKIVLYSKVNGKIVKLQEIRNIQVVDSKINMYKINMYKNKTVYNSNEEIKIEYRDLGSINTYTVISGVGNNVRRSKTNWHRWNNGVYNFSKHKPGNYKITLYQNVNGKIIKLEEINNIKVK